MKSGEQAPAACRWIPCAPGGSPATSTYMSTPVGVCSKVAEPMAAPEASMISAAAVSASAATGARTAVSATAATASDYA